jgi:hypothetical protein
LFTSAGVPEWIQQATDLFAGDAGVTRGAKPPFHLANDFDNEVEEDGLVHKLGTVSLVH